MSIFDDFTSPMSEMFRISTCGLRNKNKIVSGPVSANEMMGWNTRDVTTVPLARGRSIPHDLVMNFCVTNDKFDCFVGGKRQWVPLSDIFDIDVRSIYELMVLAGLDSNFDSNIPMWEDTQAEIEEPQPSIKPNKWFSDGFAIRFNTHDTKKYWELVVNQIVRNIQSHIREGVVVKVHGGVDQSVSASVWSDYTKEISIDLDIISIDNMDCYWLNSFDYVRDMIQKTQLTKFINPKIKIKCVIVKDHQKTPEEEYNEEDVKLVFHNFKR